MAIISTGEKVHVIHRQFFQGDVRRHFVGTVEACDGSLVRLKGYLFAADTKLNKFVKQGILRTRIISLASESLLINVLPKEVNVERITYNYTSGGQVTVTDGGDWHLDISHV
jgi:hypothetical protein